MTKREGPVIYWTCKTHKNLKVILGSNQKFLCDDLECELCVSAKKMHADINKRMSEFLFQIVGRGYRTKSSGNNYSKNG